MPKRRTLHINIHGILYKNCCLCKIWKTFDNFGKRMRTWDNMYSRCKTCINAEYYKSHYIKKKNIFRFEKLPFHKAMVIDLFRYNKKYAISICQFCYKPGDNNYKRKYICDDCYNICHDSEDLF
jgi:hypothetical protein